jgi:hypothetical protein
MDTHAYPKCLIIYLLDNTHCSINTLAICQSEEKQFFQLEIKFMGSKLKILYILFLFCNHCSIYCQSVSLNITAKPDYMEDDFLLKPKSVEIKRYAAVEKFGQITEVFIDSTFILYDTYGRMIKKINNVSQSVTDDLKPKWEGNWNKYQEPDFYDYNVSYNIGYNSEGFQSYLWLKRGGPFDGKCFKSEAISDGTMLTLKDVHCGRDNPNQITYYTLDNNRNIVKEETNNSISIRKYNNNDSLIENKIYDKDGRLKSSLTKSYNSANKVIKIIFEEIVQGKDKNTRIQTYEYNNLGDITTIKEDYKEWYRKIYETKYTLFKNEYVDKKINKKWKYLRVSDNYNKIKDYLIDMTEFKKFDFKGNWTTKYVYSNCFQEQFCKVKYYKFTRNINY